MEHNHTMHDEHSGHARSSLLKKIAIGAAVTAGAVILAPYVFPAIGIGSTDLALEALGAMHGVGLGTGLVGFINTGVNAIPFIGHALAQGGLLSAAATGITGIGGLFLSKFIEKKEDGKKGVHWSKVVKYGALATSALIALPSLLTGLSVGIVYLSAAFSGVALASKAVGLLAGTLGSMGAMSPATLGFSGAVAALPHLLTCGGALFPVFLTSRFSRGQKKGVEKAPEPSIDHSKHKPMQAERSVSAKVQMDSPVQMGVPCTGKIILKDIQSGLPLTAEELARVHTEKFHCFIIDDSLSDYNHLHPQPTGKPGEYSFSFIPKTNNGYSAWTDITLLKDNSNHKIKSQITTLSTMQVPSNIQPNNTVSQNGMRFEWSSNSPLTKDKPSMVEVLVTDEKGNPVNDLQPVMGAYGHLVGFSADGKSLIHTHPVSSDSGGNEFSNSRLRFHVEPEVAEPTQFYLHIKRNGKEMYVPFGQQVQEVKSAVDRFVVPRQEKNVLAGAVGR